MEQSEKKYNCPLSATIQLIGGKYKSLIQWHLTGKTESTAEWLTVYDCHCYGSYKEGRETLLHSYFS